MKEPTHILVRKISSNCLCFNDVYNDKKIIMGFFSIFKKKKVNTEKKDCITVQLSGEEEHEGRRSELTGEDLAYNLIKESSALARQKKFKEGAELIEKALSIYDDNKWRDKLANYYKKAGEDKKALFVLTEMTKRNKWLFGNDVAELNRLRIWEKDGYKKEKYEVIIFLKNLIAESFYSSSSYLLEEDNKYQSEEAQQIFDKYFPMIKSKWMIINKKATKLEKSFYGSYSNNLPDSFNDYVRCKLLGVKQTADIIKEFQLIDKELTGMGKIGLCSKI